MAFESVTPMHHFDDHGKFCHPRPVEARGLVAVVATLSKGYDLEYIWKQVDRGPAKDAASYYIQASESGGEPPGRWWGPGAKALALEPGQQVDREPYDLLFGERQVPGGRPQSRRPLRPAAGRRAACHRRTQARTPHRGRPESPPEPPVLRPDPLPVQVHLDLPRLPLRERPPAPPGRRQRRRPVLDRPGHRSRRHDLPSRPGGLRLLSERSPL